MIRFGPSGNSKSFYDQGYSSSVQMPAWLKNMGLNAYEYQCSKGVNIGKSKAIEIGEQAKEHDIYMSIHAPYYINLISEDPEKKEKSIQYILQSMEAAVWMYAERVVVHVGSCTGIDRKEALKIAISSMKETIARADDLGLGNISICPETLGKINQFGTLDEILELCLIDERMIPTIDFGHLYARSGGKVNSVDEFAAVLERIEEVLGYERLKKIHAHFSRIEFTSGGEKRHWTLEDIQYGPEFDYLAEAICDKKMEPVIICESRENMAEDALKLKNIYERIAARENSDEKQ